MYLFSGFRWTEMLFFAVFALIFIVFCVIAVRKLKEWRENNRAPRLTVDALVVSRRADTAIHQHPVGGDVTGASGFSTTSSTTYYVTFEVESGDRMELTVPHSEYGYLCEGDRGRLHVQGTRYLGFDRT